MKRPNWDEYFLTLAEVCSRRSTCLRRHYGSVVMKDNVVISTGYNGACRGESNCSDRGYCEREHLNIPPGQMYEKCRAVHAEMNACVAGAPERMIGATIYISGTEAKTGESANAAPCLLCKRVIKNAQIARVVYHNSAGEIIMTDTSSL